MKKASSTKKNNGKPSDDLWPEYDFDYSKAKENRFAERYKAGGRTVVLEPDVAAVFANSESVNAVIRGLISAMPKIS